VDWIVRSGHKVMLDLKFFDISEKANLAAHRSMIAECATVHGKPSNPRVGARGDVKLLTVTFSPYRFYRKNTGGR
jgi:orotidine-5'-phosphate decarboxylase